MLNLRFTKQEVFGLATGFAATFIPVIWYQFSALQLNHTFIYPVDDTFIHMQLAKNLAHYGNWGINPHEFSAASSSVLYTLILALLTILFSANMVLPLV